jgi:hypothetical protein
MRGRVREDMREEAIARRARGDGRKRAIFTGKEISTFIYVHQLKISGIAKLFLKFVRKLKIAKIIYF